MRRRIAVTVALCTTGALLLPAGAIAGKKTVKGTVEGDDNSKVKLVFKAGGNGPPSKLKSVKIKNVDSTCPEGGEASGNDFPKSSVSPLGTFVTRGAVSETLAAQVSGTVDPKGERVKDGKIEFFRIEGNQLGDSCGSVDYEIKKK